MKDIQVKISLKDAFTSALKAATNAAKRELAGLANTKAPSQPAGGGNQGVSVGTIAAGDLLSSAIQNVAQGVINAGSALVGAIGKQFEASADMAAGQLGATSANAALLGIGFDQSAKMTDKISADLASAANKLPGATKDYLQAFNGVSDTLVLAGGLTKSGMTDAGREMVELTALLGQASKAGSATTSTALGKMVGDTGSESLFRIDAFEKVPAFKAILEKDLQKTGKTLGDFFKLSGAEKLKHLVDVKKTLFSPEYITEMSKAADAQLDTMQAQLFDPVGGVFGFLRKVNVDGGSTSVWENLGVMTKELGLLGQALMSAIGLTGDPLVPLISGIRSVTGWAKSAASSLKSINLGDLDFGQIVSMMMSTMVTGLGNLTKSIGSNIDKAGGSANIGVMVGSAVGQAVAGFLAGLPQWVQSVAAPVVGQGILMIGGAAIGIFSQLPNMALAVVIAVGGSIGAWGQAIGMGIFQWGADIIGVLQSGASAIGSSLGEIPGYVGQIGIGLLAAILGFKIGLPGPFLAGVTQIGEALKSAVSGFTAPLSNVFTSVLDSLRNVMASIQGAINGLLSKIPGLGDVGKASSSYSGNTIGLANRDMLSGVNRIGTVGTAYSGNLLEAIRQESKMKPSGSSLVIANSSELIVPRQKLNQVTQPTQLNFSINGYSRDQILRDVGNQLDKAIRLPRLSTT